MFCFDPQDNKDFDATDVFYFYYARSLLFEYH